MSEGPNLIEERRYNGIGRARAFAWVRRLCSVRATGLPYDFARDGAANFQVIEALAAIGGGRCRAGGVARA